MKILLVLLIAFSIPQIPDKSEGTVDDWSLQAEVAYTNGHFHEAAKLYQRVIDDGVKRSEIYFNLGNAYYQLRDLGRALVNYRRAEQLTPRDEDLRLNIARVRAQRADAPNAYVGFGDQIAQWRSSWISNVEMEQIKLIIWWICCGWLMCYVLFRGIRQWLRWGFVLSLIVLVFVISIQFVYVVVEDTYRSAVILNETVSVMTGPDTKYMQIFVLHGAGEVRIIERRNEWVRVQLPDLREGWIQARSIEVI